MGEVYPAIKSAVAVFVHGLFSSAVTWDSLVSLLENDDEIKESYDLKRFQYSTPKWKIRPTRRIPDFDTVAGSLSTFLDVECAEYRNVVFVAHSQGGLLVQRFLSQMLADGRGRELARISRVVLLACPNNGSQFFYLCVALLASSGFNAKNVNCGHMLKV
jgi:pimeloyl-ACP methyl ester carboxylesterase